MHTSPRLLMRFVPVLLLVGAMTLGTAWLARSCSGLVRGDQVNQVQRGANSAIERAASSVMATPTISKATDWVGVQIATHDEIADAMASRVVATLTAKGLRPDGAEDLRLTISELVAAMFAPNFERYHAFMASRGEVLDSIAVGFCASMKEWNLLDADGAAAWDTLPLDAQVAYIWNHANLRDFEWRQVDMASLRCGFGLTYLSGSAEWPFPGAYAQVSLYAPVSGRLSRTEGAALRQSKDSAWFSVEGTFAGGYTATMRVNLYWDTATRLWVPVTLALSPDAVHRPFPLL